MKLTLYRSFSFLKIAVTQRTQKGKIKLNNEMKCVVLLYCSSIVDSLVDANLSSRPSLNWRIKITKTSRIFSTSQKQWNVRSSILLFPQGFPFFSTSSSFTRGIHTSKATSDTLTLPQIPNPRRIRGLCHKWGASFEFQNAWKLKVEEKMDKWLSSI